MSLAEMKISWKSAQRRARLEVPCRIVQQHAKPPAEIVKKITAKMDLEKTQGNIDQFFIFDKLLEETWAAIRAAGPAVAGEILQMTVGLGGYKLKGVRIEPGDEKSAFYLSLDGRADEMANWTFDSLFLDVLLQCRNAGITVKPHLIQLQGAWLRAIDGEKISGLGISQAPPLDNGKPFKILANKARRELGMAVYSGDQLRDKVALSRLLNTAADACKKMSAAGADEYVFRKEDVVSALRGAVSGPEQFGADLPLQIMIATGRDKPKPKKKPAPQAAAPEKKSKGPSGPAPSDSPVQLDIHVSQDGMEATINNFDLDTLRASTGFKPDEAWLHNEVKRFGIKKLDNNLLHKILATLGEMRDVTGMMVAGGDRGKSPEGPYVHLSYKDKSVTAPDGEGAKDLRESQASMVVQPGDLVAEVRYKKAGKPGVNVFGKKVAAEKGQALVVDMGEGIELKGEGKYYSTTEGMPVLDGTKLSVSSVFMHKGNINLKSGNVEFNGSAVIEGNIESGSTVNITGNLEVSGSISNAMVYVGGNLTVGEGIITTDKGKVVTNGDLASDYISNSNVLCKGNMKVKTSILNSFLTVGGTITMHKEVGVMAGGEISSRGTITVFRMGYPKGDSTTINVGLDWEADLSMRIRTRRLAAMEESCDTDRKKMRELIRNKGGTFSKDKKKEQKEELQQRVQRQAAIIERLKARVAEARERLTWEKNVKLYVHETLAANVKLTVGGTEIPVPTDVVAVYAYYKKRRGRYVHPIDEELRDDAV